MKLVYPREEFFAHQEAWNSHFHSAETLELAGRTVQVGNDKSTDADVMRVIFMIFSLGVQDAVIVRKKGKAFMLTQMYLRAHADELFEAGLIVLHDGEMAIVHPETVGAIHEAFLDDPPADPREVPIAAIIERARAIAAAQAAGPE